MRPADVVVIGAGIAGLTAARRLSGAGLSVTVLDKGRGVGGRLATRRMGDARLDHGAQFFTVRSERFGEQVMRWLAQGTVREWCRGFNEQPDGHPRYIGVAGMTALAKDLAEGVNVRLDTSVAAITRSAASGHGTNGWSVRTGDTATWAARAVLVTAPVPQTLDLLAAGGTHLDPGPLDALRAVRYAPTLAALVVPAGPSAVPAPGGVQLTDGLLSWVGDNAAKGVSPVPALTLHASSQASAARSGDQTGEVLEALVDAGARWIGPAGVRHAELMRWRFAQPTVLHPDRCLVAVDGEVPLVCAGDAFGEARVEGAALSGWAGAGTILDRLT